MLSEENDGKKEFDSDQLLEGLTAVNIWLKLPLTVDAAVEGTVEGVTDTTTGEIPVRTYPELIFEKYSVIW